MGQEEQHQKARKDRDQDRKKRFLKKDLQFCTKPVVYLRQKSSGKNTLTKE